MQTTWRVGAAIVIAAALAAPGGAVMVSSGTVPHEADLLAGRYRSFANTVDPEIYLGIPDLGATARRVELDIPWQSGANTFTFTFDKAADSLVATVTNGNGTFTLTDPDVSTKIGGACSVTTTQRCGRPGDGACPGGETCNPYSLDDLNLVQIGIANSDSGTTVDLSDVQLDGNPLGSGSFSGGVGMAGNLLNWTVTDYCFGAGFSISGTLTLGGTFGASPDDGNVELVAGITDGGVCRAAAGPCDVAERCTGASPACPADGKSSAVCRPAAGQCDAAESCDGVNDDCPTDGFAPPSTVCRAGSTNEVCDATEHCTGGSAACPPDDVLPNGSVCRSSQGGCDPSEACDGASKFCPPDGKSSAVCRPAMGVCDVAESCDGVNDDCPADVFQPAATVCRAVSSGDACDVAETCTGSGAACPADAVASSTTVCRGAAGVCDVAERCDGTHKTCPADAVAPGGTVCRATSSGEICDAPETCDGATVACPADAVLPNGAPCRPSAGVCDAGEACDGSSKVCPTDAKSTAQCRASSGVCDVAESCDGVGDDCPADGFVADGTPCDDTLFCNGTQTCTGGACGGGASPCAAGQSCDESLDLCFAGDCPVSPTMCRTAAKNQVVIKNDDNDAKDRLAWKWSAGDATTQMEFGDPISTADYALCFYAGATPTLLEQANVPGSSGNWSSLGTSGYKYTDGSGARDGITKIILKGGTAGRTRALLKGKGENLPDFDSHLPVAGTDLPLVVQLRNKQSGVCWGGWFTIPRKNLPEQYNAKTP